jgi:chromosome segregation ATPase
MLENDIKTCQETCARLNTLTENLKNEMSASMKEIVTNAEEVISLKNAANEQIELERLGFSEDQRKMIEQSGRVEIIDNLVTKLQEANLLLQPYETALTSYKSMKKNMKDLKKRSLELDGMIKKKQYSLTNLERSVRSSEDQFNRAQKQNESKMHSLEKILIDRQAEKQQLIFEKQSLERKINDLNDQLAAMQHELSNKKAEYETSLQTLENEHLKILKRAEEYRTIVIQMIQQCPFFGTKESLQS